MRSKFYSDDLYLTPQKTSQKPTAGRRQFIREIAPLKDEIKSMLFEAIRLGRVNQTKDD